MISGDEIRSKPVKIKVSLGHETMCLNEVVVIWEILLKDKIRRKWVL